MISPIKKTTYEDADVMARTMYGEARSQGEQGMWAVACVIMNRLTVAVEHGKYWWGNTINEICLKHEQFSCWNTNDPNYKLILAVNENDRQFGQCFTLATAMLNHGGDDITNGATMYYARSMAEPPSWADGLEPCAEIGEHRFYAVGWPSETNGA